MSYSLFYIYHKVVVKLLQVLVKKKKKKKNVISWHICMQKKSHNVFSNC